MGQKNQIPKRKLKFWAKQVEILHIIVFVLTIFSIMCIFLVKELRLICSFYLVGIFVIEKLYGFCPLTRLQNLLLRTAGMDVKKRKFIPRFLKKYYDMDAPDWLAELAMFLFFLLGMIIIIKDSVLGG